MKKSLFVVLSFCAMAILGNGSTLSAQERNAIEYQVQDNEYAVVIVFEEGMKEADAKLSALKHAAELTQKNKYRYFDIEKEEYVQAVGVSDSAEKDPAIFGYDSYVLLQDKILEQGNSNSQESIKGDIYPAYRLTFKCYLENPSDEGIDSCRLMACKK